MMCANWHDNLFSVIKLELREKKNHREICYNEANASEKIYDTIVISILKSEKIHSQ